MKAVYILLAGMILVTAGIFFALQGAGIVQYPRESFMVGSPPWIERGLLIGLAGVALILLGRRLHGKK